LSLQKGGRRMVIKAVKCLALALIGVTQVFGQIDTIKTVDISVDEKGQSNEIDGAQLKTHLSENEFKKAACCTLSESFELSNTVEVSNRDGVSGIRQVEMLGLAGKYVLMTRNNMPLLNGLAVLNGLSNIPGSFVSGVNIAKGNGSTTLGYEGITGGIDYQLKSSAKEPKLFLNGYQNNQGRSELNALIRKDLGRNFRSYTFLHGGNQWWAMDQNKDGFSDMPLTSRIYLGNQSHFQTKNKEGMIGITYWNDQKNAGQMSSVGSNELSDDNAAFRFQTNESRLEAVAKLGIIPEEGETTFGNILNFSNHDMNYGLNNQMNRRYRANEMRVNYSGLVQAELSEKVGTKSGISLLANQLTDNFYTAVRGIPLPPAPNDLSITNNINERQAGVFSEWVFNLEPLTFVAGTRADYHNMYGLFLTPRIHAKWEIDHKQHIFVQVGYGRRTPYVFAEYLPHFINSRELIYPNENTQNTALPYGLQQERATNFGLSYLKNFMFLGFPSHFSVDLFRTQFDSRVVIDHETPYLIKIQSLQGEKAGFSQSIHTEWSFMPAMRLEVKLAYRYIQNEYWLNNEMRMKPFLSKHRALTTITYQTRSKWYFDMVGNVIGPQRVPARNSTTPEFYSPTFALFNAQVRKQWKSGLELYVGSENIGNYRQFDPIYSIQARNNLFLEDASYNWGPSNGRMIYLGFRYSIK